MEEKPDFILFGVLDLAKSLESKAAADQGLAEKRLIFGEITNLNKDEDDEVLKALDWDYFDTNGWIKYEHVLNDPSHVIGCPHERVTTPAGGTLIKGALFNDTEYANAVWAMIKNIEEHNRLYPEFQKTLGWSIEGAYTDGKVAKGGPRRAKVVNVVITPNPVNKTVYLQRLQENHAIFAKALSYGDEVKKAMAATPTSTDVSQKTGVDAIAKENIDKKVKETAEDPLGSGGSKTKKKRTVKKSSNGSHKMKTFKDVAEAITHFQGLGHSEEDAGVMAKSLFPEDEADPTAPGGEEAPAGEPEEAVTLLKGLTIGLAELKATMFKSKSPEEALPAADDLETIPGEEDEGEFIDAGPMLMGLQKSLGAVADLLDQKVAYDHQRDETMAKAFEAMGTFLEGLGATNAEMKKSLFITEGDKSIPLSAAVMALMKSRPGAKVDLSAFQVTGEGESEGGGADAAAPVKDWKELQTKLAKGVEAGKITQAEVSQAETSFRVRGWDVVKSILAKIDD